MREVCSCWMHYSPAVVAYTFRWHSEAIKTTFPGMFKFDVNEPLYYWGLGDVSNAALYYIFAWAIPFYVVLFFVKGRLAKKGYKTLIHHVCEGDMLKSIQSQRRPVVYVLGHFFLSVIAMVLSLLWWKIKVANFAFYCFLFFGMIHTGGKRYWEVYFAKMEKEGSETTYDKKGKVGTAAAVIGEKTD